MVVRVRSETSPASAVAPVEQVQNALRDKGGLDILTIDMHGKSSLSDYMVIVTGTSSTHLGTLADQVERVCDTLNIPVLSVEGRMIGDWVLVDTPEVIVHIFRPAARETFDLESMWSEPLDIDETGDIEHIV